MRRIMEIPWPAKKSHKIWPVFLPYLGCPGKCVFCAQETQTGQAAPNGLEQVKSIFAQSYNYLAKEKESGRKAPDLAFYGGTFTALPDGIFQLCINFAQDMLEKNLVSGYRCSTRPDCLPEKRLAALSASGCSLVELGIQSFSDKALRVSGRGYNSMQARAACAILSQCGLGPGVQLMPGMPGSQKTDFLKDVETALNLGAVCLRFYPCLCLAGTPLADMWRNGAFPPWGLEETVENLAKGWLMAAKKGVPVIRMGLASQPGLEKAILAGPRHKSLGSMVKGLALLLAIEELEPEKPFRLFAPKSMQGAFWGWKGSLGQRWHKLGLVKVEFWEQDNVRLEYMEEAI